ncbi:MAG: hypothetical protein AB7W16_23065 [Candidatus Obscuribacterales bacterium]
MLKLLKIDSDSLLETMRSELEPQEQLLWHGSPSKKWLGRQSIKTVGRLAAYTALIMAVAAPIAIAVHATILVINFMVIGVVIALFRLLMENWPEAAYAITDRRVMVVGRRVHQAKIADVTVVYEDRQKDATFDLRFMIRDGDEVRFKGIDNKDLIYNIEPVLKEKTFKVKEIP